jgi:hypothetical protein
MSEKVCVIVSVRQSSPMGNVVKPTASMSGRKKSAQAKATVPCHGERARGREPVG